MNTHREAAIGKVPKQHGVGTMVPGLVAQPNFDAEVQRDMTTLGQADTDLRDCAPLHVTPETVVGRFRHQLYSGKYPARPRRPAIVQCPGQLQLAIARIFKWGNGAGTGLKHPVVAQHPAIGQVGNDLVGRAAIGRKGENDRSGKD
jgi:hypothetical protein